MLVQTSSIPTGSQGPVFDYQLLRLKRELRVSTDGEVAKALGMTKAAFSERKRRNSFPKDKLLALVGFRPELKVDAAYVLTGIPSSTPAMPESVRATLQQAVFEQLRRDLPVDEQLLLDTYRALDDRAKKRMLSQMIASWPSSPRSGSTLPQA
nr:helix-turn-helix domain-containing protein [Variovorax sp. SG517]